jgi:ABC-type nitrate/sulfonate/bicarbonate transport system permease component
MAGMKKVALGFWLPVLLLATWQWMAGHAVLDPLFFPPPSVLLAAGEKMLASGELFQHVGATLARALGGFLSGAVAGMAFGLLMGASRGMRQSLEPMMSAFYSTPKLSLFPMLLLLLGVGDAAKIALIGLSTFILVAFHALDAVLNINTGYVEMARNYGARKGTLLRTVYLPACLPQVFTGLRLALGRALVTAISVELISSRDGLGSLIWLSWQTLATERLYVAVITAATLGVLMHVTVRRLERGLIRWKERDDRS